MILLCCLIFTSCKTTAPIVAPSVVIRDSMSITYKQGKKQPFSLNQIEEQPASPDAIGAAHSSICVIDEGLPEIATGATSSELATTASGRLIIRVDTVFVERWHTQILQPEGRSYSESGPSGEAGLSAKRSQFYKRCTWGFFLLILLFFGRLAFRIIKAIYFKR